LRLPCSFTTAGLAGQAARPAIIDLWMSGKPAFGIYAPNENPGPADKVPARRCYSREGGEKLAMNPLYDFVFLNLEGSYDGAAIKAIADGLRSGNRRGPQVAHRPHPANREGRCRRDRGVRVKQAFDAGADGVTIPHVRSVDEAKQAIGFFRDARANVWSPANRKRRPDCDADAGGFRPRWRRPGRLPTCRATAFLRAASAASPRRSAAIREGAEAGTQKVLAEARRAKLVDMLTFNAQDAGKRVKEGFLALLTQGAAADEAIMAGRAVAGR
jgi:hypothetical protein